MKGKRPTSEQLREYRAAYLMSAPVVLGTIIFFLIPAIWSLWLSFTSGPDYSTYEFVGFKNYVDLLTNDANLKYELFNTFYYAIVVVVF